MGKLTCSKPGRAELIVLHIAVLLPLAAALTWPAFMKIEDLEAGGGIPCPHRWLTGRPCWWCGITRAFCCILHGEMGRAAAYHPAGLLLYCLLAAGAVLASASLIKAARPAADRSSSRV